MSESELEGLQEEMAEEGKAEMERTEEAELEAILAEICAKDPHAPLLNVALRPAVVSGGITRNRSPPPSPSSPYSLARLPRGN